MNWSQHYHIRNLALLAIDECPKYFLLPEVDALINGIDDGHAQMMIRFLFNTGARVSEMLAVTSNDIYFNEHGAYVVLKTLKQQQKGAGRIKKADKTAKRIVPLLDNAFVLLLKRYIVTHCKNKRMPIFSVSDETVRNKINEAYHRCQEKNIALPFKPSPHTFRHAFAINLLLNHVHIRKIQLWLGHKTISSTLIYTKVIGIDSGMEDRGIAFSLPIESNPLLYLP